MTAQQFFLGCLVVLAFASSASSARSSNLSPGENVIEEELTSEQIAYYRDIFVQYDENADQKISMEENLAQDRIIADDGHKPFDEVQSRLSFERADSDKDGFVSFEELTAPRSPEEQCKQLYGEFAEYDGARSCRCVTGYTADVNGTCIKGSNEVCTMQFGPHAEFDGINNCQCKNGTISNVNGTCVEGTDQACQAMYGELAHFEKTNSSCACNNGSVPDSNGTCVTASNELCMEWFGPNTVFNGINSCVCKKGFVYADGECFKGNNKICGSIIAGSKFDGNNNCECRRGYHIDAVRAICIKTPSKPANEGGKVEEAKPAPKQGTLSVTLVEAKHLPKMDVHTKCDAFVVITLGNQTKKSKVIKKTYHPHWEQSFVMSYTEAHETPQSVLIEVFDWDKVGAGEYIGHVELQLGDLLADGLHGMLDLRAKDGALVRGHDKNTSAIYLEVSMTDSLPWVPPWDPILEEKPGSVLLAVRLLAGLAAPQGLQLSEPQTATPPTSSLALTPPKTPTYHCHPSPSRCP